MKRIKSFLSTNLTAVIVVMVLLVIGSFAAFSTQNEDGSRTFGGNSPTYTDAQEDAVCDAKASADQALKALSGIDVPQDATSGCAETEPQMGSQTYYKVDVSTPTAFYNNVNGKGFNEGYGLQCVAGFKQFMFSLSGKYIAAAGGGAKGYASQQAAIEPLGFKWYTGSSGLQNGDWGIWTNGTYGHVAMYYNGKWFGQNQGAANPNVGNAFNLLSISTNGLAGYYRPNIYQNATPTPDPTPVPTPTPGGNTGVTPGTSSSYTVRQGDTLGGIALKNGWYGSSSGLYGNSGYAQSIADFNGIPVRGLIYPNQVIKRP